MPIIPLKSNIVLHSRYQILEKIGAGGFGITYTAKDLGLEVKLVIKEFALDLICSRDSTNATIAAFDGYETEMTKWSDKFVLEARNLAKIKHQGVVRVLDVWKEKGTVYYAMEHIKGGELSSPIDRKWESKSWLEVEKVAIALLEALHEVHNAGLLHGDIKPANILIREDSGLPVLIDFGTARSLEEAQNKTATTMAFTPGYAPIELQERSHSKKTGPSSDLYSWAMVVLGMLSKFPHGDLPTDAKTRMIVFVDAKKDKYNKKSLRKWLPNSVPNSVVSILASCLMLESKDRPQSVNAVLKQLKSSKLPDNVLKTSGNKDESRVVNTNNNKMILFTLIIGTIGILVGIIGIGLFLSENNNANNCDAGAQRINGECISSEKEKISGIEMNHEDPNITDLFLCDENEFVLSHACELCASGLTNEAGDDASGDNTVCEVTYCGNNEFVLSHACEPCTSGLTNEAGDDASGDNTACAPEGFAWIPAGSFMMGSPDNEVERTRWNNNERLHEVTISRPFYMQTHEVTQGEWQVLMRNNPSYFSYSGDGSNCGSNCPVEMVNWWETLAYANALSRLENLQECYVLSDCINSPGNDMECSNISWNFDCLGYRLPTEAEWEYAARAGTTTMFYNGKQTPDDIAWYRSNSNRRTHPVGQLEANSWGLYDMSGNVWEWCWDRYGSYGSSSVTDPTGADSGSSRVFRGGAWIDLGPVSRSANRVGNNPRSRHHGDGFRIVRSAP